MEPSLPLTQAAEALFGTPLEATVEQEILPWEMDLIERVCGDTRFHDLTTFVLDGTSLAMVHKPSDPDGVYWVPAGGLHADERLDQGVRREVREETGLDVRVERYLLRLEAFFTCGVRSRPWTSHVFVARPSRPAELQDRLHPEDTKEVERAAWIDVDTFVTHTVPILRSTGWGRFGYRLRMAELVFAELGLALATDGIGTRPPLDWEW
jgi:8-oxo-dGTP pyrophosphatase MutT (NUDIX family)